MPVPAVAYLRSGPKFDEIGELNLRFGPEFAKFLKKPDQTYPGFSRFGQGTDWTEHDRMEARDLNIAEGGIFRRRNTLVWLSEGRPGPGENPWVAIFSRLRRNTLCMTDFSWDEHARDDVL